MRVRSNRRSELDVEGDGPGAWARLEARGCVAQVNAPAAEARGSDFNHRVVGASSACREDVSVAVAASGGIAAIVRALLRTEDVRLFNDQYVVKPPTRSGTSLRSSCFDWHHDSQWCRAEEGDEDWVCAPYLSCWVALDDVSEENGTLRMLPYPPAASHASHRERARAYPPRDSLASPLTDDSIDSIGRLLTMRAGSVVFFSDLVLHCSGPNVSDAVRRAWMPQFSAGPVLRRNGRAVSLTAKLA